MSTMTKHAAVGIEYLLRSGDPTKCLVLLHGIGSNAYTFDRLCDRLPPDWTLLSWTAPGYGGSEPLADPKPRAGDYAGKLHLLARELGLQRFSLVGHSLGTLIATEFAVNYRSMVDEVVLMSCAQGYGMRKGDALPEKAAARLRNLKDLGLRIFAETRAPKLMNDPEGQPEVCAGAVEAMATIDPYGYAQAVHMLAAGHLAARMPAVKAPCLVMVGEYDRITPPEQSKMAYEALKSADNAPPCAYREIPDAGHIVHQERPGPVADEISGFVRFSRTSFDEASR